MDRGFFVFRWVKKKVWSLFISHFCPDLKKNFKIYPGTFILHHSDALHVEPNLTDVQTKHDFHMVSDIMNEFNSVVSSGSDRSVEDEVIYEKNFELKG